MKVHEWDYRTSRAFEAVKSALPRGVTVEPDSSLSVGEANLGIRINGHPFALWWLGRGSCASVLKVVQSDSGFLNRVIVVPQLSDRARGLAEENDIGWIEETGAGIISTRDMVVYLEGDHGKPTPLVRHWTPTVQGVAEALLTGVQPTVNALTAVGVSQASASRALAFLTDQRLLLAEQARGPKSGRILQDKDLLLESYASTARLPEPSVDVGVLWNDPLREVESLGTILEEEGISWAVTGALTAATVAPVGTQISPMIMYLSVRTMNDLLGVCRRTGLRVIEGGRLQMRPFPSPITKKLSQVIPRTGVTSVSLPRAYADLRNSGVRGEEAAEGLRELILS